MTTGGAAGGAGESVGQGLIDIQVDLTSIRAELQRLSSMVEDNVQEQDQAYTQLGTTIKTTLVGAAAAASAALIAAFGAATTMAQETTQGANRLQTQLGITADEAERLGDIGEKVFANNFGENVGAAIDGVKEVRAQIKGLAEEEIQGVTEAAFGIQDAFGEELPKTVNTVNTLMKDFGLSATEATDFLTAGFQRGLNASGDFLDTIGEYSTQFANGGATADQFFSLMESGLQGGVLGTDKAADAFKEFRVRIQDGSSATSDSLKMLGIDADDLSKKMSSGQVSAAQAFQLVLDKLRGVDDANLRMQAGVGLLGTQYEDLGQKSVDALTMASTKLSDLNGATQTLNAQYNDLPNMLASAWRGFLLALEPAGKELLKVGMDLMPLIQQGAKDIGAVLGPMLVDVAGDIATVVRWFTTWSDSVGGLRGVLREAWNTIENGTIVVGGLATAIFLTNDAIRAQVASSIMGALSSAWAGITAAVTSSVIPALTTLRTVISGLLGPIGLVTAALTSLVLYANQVAQEIQKTYDQVAAGIAASHDATMSKINQLAKGSELDKLNAKILALKSNLADMNPEDEKGKAALKARIDLLEKQAVSLRKTMDASKATTAEQNRHTQSINVAVPTIKAYVAETEKKETGTKKATAAQKAAIKAADEWKRTLDGIKLNDYRDGLRNYSDTQLKAAENNARAAKDSEKLNAVLAEQSRRMDAAFQSAASWKSNLDQIKFDKWADGLKNATDAQLQNALKTAETTQNVRAYNSILAEQERRVQAAKDKQAAYTKALQDSTLALEDLIEKAQSGLFNDGRDRPVSIVDLDTLQKNLGEISTERIPAVIAAVESLINQGAIVDKDGSITAWLASLKTRADDAASSMDEARQAAENLANWKAGREFEAWKTGLGDMSGTDLSALKDELMGQLENETSLPLQALIMREIDAVEAAISAYNARAIKMVADALKAEGDAYSDFFKARDSQRKADLQADEKARLDAQNNAIKLIADALRDEDKARQAFQKAKTAQQNADLKAEQDRNKAASKLIAGYFAEQEKALTAFVKVKEQAQKDQLKAEEATNKAASKLIAGYFAEWEAGFAEFSAAKAAMKLLPTAEDIQTWVDSFMGDLESMTTDMAQVLAPQFEQMLSAASAAGLDVSAWQPFLDVLKDIASTTEAVTEGFDNLSDVVNPLSVDIQRFVDENLSDLTGLTADMASVLLPQLEQMLAAASADGLDVSGWQAWLDILREIAGQTDITTEAVTGMTDELKAQLEQMESLITRAAQVIQQNFQDIFDGVVGIGQGLAAALANITDMIVQSIIQQIIAQQVALAAKAIMDGAWLNFAGAAAAIAGAAALGALVGSLTSSVGKVGKVSGPSAGVDSQTEKSLFGKTPDVQYASMGLTLERAGTKMLEAANKFSDAIDRGIQVNVAPRATDWRGLL